jgi:hypothetical protein
MTRKGAQAPHVIWNLINIVAGVVKYLSNGRFLQTLLETLQNISLPWLTRVENMEYTVGWICALHCAARAILDEIDKQIPE